jgi:hypothetical protein
LGAAFLSNASYTETLKILKQTDLSLEPFALAGARQMFAYNYTTGLTQAVTPTPQAFISAVTAELPRYAALWNARFKNVSVANYKVWLAPMWDRNGALTQEQQNGVPTEFTVSGAQWFRNNNLTALPTVLVNPVALYGYGDINIVPAVRHEPTSAQNLHG